MGGVLKKMSTQTIKVGIDFGTTNTSVAIMGDGSNVQVLPIDPLAVSPSSLRTMLYIERGGEIHIGQKAINTYYEQNVGRMPKLVKQWVGEIDIVITEGGTVVLDAYTDVDADAPGRLIHSLKSPLATDYQGTTIFGKYISLEDLIATFLTQLRERINAILGSPVSSAVFGRPVNFVGANNDDDNDKAQARLAIAARRAGFTDIDFELEPIAAGLSYGLEAITDQRDRHILVFDFGGGTLDTAVIHISPDQTQQVISTGGIGIAGDHFDRAMVQKGLVNWFGGKVKWGEKHMELPSHLLHALGEWQELQLLATPPVLAFLNQAQRNCTDPMRLFALEDLISKGYAYTLFEQVENVKVALSKKRWAILDYSAGAISIWQPYTRSQFESYIALERRLITDMVIHTVAKAGLAPKNIDFVVRTGGSSSIPCFMQLLADIFGSDRIIEQDLFTGVAAGLAIRAKNPI
jgi:hypothetical chaperone protein